MEYCSLCGKGTERMIPKGDTHHRYVCSSCGKIHYSNPKIIVGSIPIWEKKKVLLCKRSIEPGFGLWTLPSGFMENHESAEEGAIRETREEARANIQIQNLHTIYSIPHLSQVYLLFSSILMDSNFSPGEETLEVKLFGKDEIPWDQIAFSSVAFSLRHIWDKNREQIEDKPERTVYSGCFIKSDQKEESESIKKAKLNRPISS